MKRIDLQPFWTKTPTLLMPRSNTEAMCIIIENRPLPSLKLKAVGNFEVSSLIMVVNTSMIVLFPTGLCLDTDSGPNRGVAVCA